MNKNRNRFYTFVSIWLLFSNLCFGESLFQANNLMPEEQNLINIFEKMAPLVVNVHKINHVINPSIGFVPVETGAGSGFLWDDKGHIVTNYHVVAGANEVIVTFKNGKEAHAKILGIAPKKDIAVLKLNSKDLENLKFKQYPIINANELHVGQNVISIGNPFGLDHTLTRGIISALNRQLPQGDYSLHDLIQTDASINPGNSGGPLLNSQGGLIGMTTAIYSTSGSSAGIGFAIPSNDIKKITEQIIKDGKFVRAGIGITVFDDAIAQQLDIQGVLVNKVTPNSPASLVGLRGTKRDVDGGIILGDLIIQINQHPIKSVKDLLTSLENTEAGDEIKLTVLRQGKTYNLSMHSTQLD